MNIVFVLKTLYNYILAAEIARQKLASNGRVVLQKIDKRINSLVMVKQ